MILVVNLDFSKNKVFVCAACYKFKNAFALWNV